MNSCFRAHNEGNFMSTLFQGLSAFPITPTDKAGVVDTSALAIILDRIQEAGADSI